MSALTAPLPLQPTLASLSTQIRALTLLPSTTPSPAAASYRPPGILACQRAPHQQTLRTELLAIQLIAPPAAKKKPPTPPPALHALTFADSILFPTGGGQPCDTGTVTLTVSGVNHDLQVVDVVNESGVCVVVVSGAVPEIADISSVLVLQTVNWSRRLDHMTQHTGQHLISALALDTFGLQTHSWNLTATGACYIDFKPVVGDEVARLDVVEKDGVIGRLEEQVNGKIMEDTPVTAAWYMPEDPVFKEKVRSRLLPKGFEGEVRTVTIEGVDTNTCCGTHVARLGELLVVKFVKVERVKKNILRVHFVAGDRVRALFEKHVDQAGGIGKVLGTGDLTEQVERVRKLEADNKKLKSTVTGVWDQLVAYKIKELASEKVAVCDLGESLVEADVYKKLVRGVKEASGEAGYCIFVISGNEEGATFLLESSDPAIVDSRGKEVCGIVGGKGGGKKGTMMGKIAAGGWRAKLGEVRQALERE